MTKTVIKTIFRGPSTRRYPFGARRGFYKNARGSISNDIKNCIFCGLCQAKCPTKALSVEKAQKIWSIDRLRCITCGYCTEVCPKKCLKMENFYSEPVSERKKEVYQSA